MGEPIVMPFGLWTRVGQSNHVLDGGPDLHPGRGCPDGENGPAHGHALPCQALDILKASLHGVELVRMPIGMH